VQAQNIRSKQSGAVAQMPAGKIEEAALGGTGPYSKLYAGLDAFFGGLGVDAAFGKEGFFPQTQANRNKLRNFNQLAKIVLVNNPKFPVAEQEIVSKMLANPDEFWNNPDNEANKYRELRTTLSLVRGFTANAIKDASTDDVFELQQKVRELDNGQVQLVVRKYKGKSTDYVITVSTRIMLK